MKLLANETAEKVLGLWDHRKDVFTFKVNVKSSKQEQTPRQRMTERKILSQIARIFDLLGFAAASTVKAKIGMQRLWQKGVDWDEKLPVSRSQRSPSLRIPSDSTAHARK